jgi:hypothetical protein
MLSGAIVAIVGAKRSPEELPPGRRDLVYLPRARRAPERSDEDRRFMRESNDPRN